MIWQLMKRDQTWQWTPLAAIFALIYTLGGSSQNMTTFMLLGWIGCYAPAFYTYCTLYEGALPIAAKDLWLARVLSLLAAMWVPVAITSVLLLAGHRDPAPLLEAAGVYTVMVAGVKSIRNGAFLVPKGLRFVGVVVLGTTAAAFPLLDRQYMPSAGLVLAICGAASATLFVKGWRSLPKSFQIAALESAPELESTPKLESATKLEAAPKAAVATRRLGWVWSLSMRSVYGWHGTFLLGLTVSLATFGTFLFWVITLPSVMIAVRQRIRWLLLLPVSSRALFGMIVLPVTAAVLLGSVGNAWVDVVHPSPLNVRMVSTAGQLMSLYLFVVVLETYRWRRLSKLPPMVRGVLPLIAGAVVIAGLSVSAHQVRSVLADAARWLAGMLPESWPLLPLALMVPVTMAYWLAERIFSELEYPNLRATIGLDQ